MTLLTPRGISTGEKEESSAGGDDEGMKEEVWGPMMEVKGKRSGVVI